ncbi:MAG: hypothetical protein CMJ31_10915 [Phycisphaerae bacterium]|nr:hypothetical protein [Phycisphaerae bacterium]
MTTEGSTVGDDASSDRDGAGGRPVGLSIRDFLTDGSLASLCAALSSLSGLDVQLRDESGRRIVASDDSGLWTILDQEASGEAPAMADRVPILLGDQAVGEIVVAPGAPSLTGASREHVLSVARAVRATAGEVIADVTELRHRVKELDVLHRLSAMLTSPNVTPEAMLDAALASALDALDLDAGSIVLLPTDADGMPSGENEGELRLMASRNLSREWLESPVPLSQDREFDRTVLSGRVLAIEDLLADPRTLTPARLEREGVRGFISAAMISRERLIGVIRLYSRSVRRFTPPERLLLKSIGEQAAAAVEQATLLHAQQEERRIQRQLKLASAVQARMLPARLPKRDGVDIAARSVPSTELAGDFYDVFGVEDRLGIVIGDVVGKGVAAALMMSSVRGSLRAFAQDTAAVDTVLTRTNRAMCRDTLDNEFATTWYGVLDPETGALEYCSAGHEPPFVIRAREGDEVDSSAVRPLGVGGLVLGVDAGQVYKVFQHRLEPGDVLVAYTDGLTDARDFSNEKFGFSRLVHAVVDALRENVNASAEDVLERVMWTLRQFSGLREQVDDETIVVLRYRGGGAERDG